MAIVQNTWNNAPDIGFPGMVANGETSNRISRIVEDAAGLAYGKFAWRGTGDRGAILVPAAGTILGVAMVDHGNVVVPGGIAADIVPQGRSVGLMTKGAIYVTAGVAVADGDQVYVTSAGVITNVSTSNVICPGWFFDDTLAATGLVRIVNRG